MGMKIQLVALNAKYIHSNLALRNLRDFLLSNQEFTGEIVLSEYSINQLKDTVIRGIFEMKPDVIGFSCYIWNISLVCEIASTLKKLLPQTVIFAGGPEVSFETETFLKEYPQFDYVLQGEGELSFTELMLSLQNKSLETALQGVAFLDQAGVYHQGQAPPILNMDLLPFPYQENDFQVLSNRILYYETSRGCPFLCQYCLSGLKEKVRGRSLHLVKEDLLIFLKNRVKQVKFVDRTFNYDPKRALEIWEFLMEHDNKITNFHFELGADLVDEHTLERLKGARKGLFQFEIGVQTTNPLTSKYIKRPADFKKISHVVKQVKKMGNIHQHLDLIAGLPAENYTSFGKSFNDVFFLEPEQLQLGFLKVLKGSGLYLDREKYCLNYDNAPPYEILSTDVLSYEDVLKLKVLEDCVERYHNSLKYTNTIAYLLKQFPNPFAMFESLASYFGKHGYDKPLSKEAYTKVLFDFSKEKDIDTFTVGWLLRFDSLLNERPGRHYNWLPPSLFETYREKTRLFFEDKTNWSSLLPEFNTLSNRQIVKHAHIEVFPFDPFHKNYLQRHTPLLFSYSGQNSSGTVQKVIL